MLVLVFKRYADHYVIYTSYPLITIVSLWDREHSLPGMAHVRRVVHCGTTTVPQHTAAILGLEQLLKHTWETFHSFFFAQNVLVNKRPIFSPQPNLHISKVFENCWFIQIMRRSVKLFLVCCSFTDGTENNYLWVFFQLVQMNVFKFHTWLDLRCVLSWVMVD